MELLLNLIVVIGLTGGCMYFVAEVFRMAGNLLLYARRRSFLSLVATELEGLGVTVEYKRIVNGEMLLRLNHYSIEKARPIQIPATFKLEQVLHDRFALFLVEQAGIDLDAPELQAEA